MSEIVAINKSAVSPGNDTCLKGSEQPAVSLGGDIETTLLCIKDDSTIFDYTGRFPSGVLNFRVSRATEDGPITVDDAKAWSAEVAERVAKLK